MSAASIISWRRRSRCRVRARLLTVEATRQAGAKAHSNIRWTYGHQTIPRHLRDVSVTEYGVADLRGKSDADVIAAMLAVTDSRFQGELARQAKDAGKLPKDFEIPAAHRENFPERITGRLEAGARGGPAAVVSVRQRFHRHRAAADSGAAGVAGGAAFAAAIAGAVVAGFDAPADAADVECLARLGLDTPTTFSERAYRALVSAALARSRAG